MKAQGRFDSKKAERSTPTVIVQAIQVSWTKDSRGGGAASHRNAVPEALSIPFGQLESSSAGLIQHSVSYQEWENFSPNHYLTSEPCGQIRLGCVAVEPLGDMVRVVFEYDPKYAGMPIRYSQPGGTPSTRFELRAGQWGRILYNGRFTGDVGWWYEKHAINIGFLENPNENVFLAGDPAHVINQMDRLW